MQVENEEFDGETSFLTHLRMEAAINCYGKSLQVLLLFSSDKMLKQWVCVFVCTCVCTPRFELLIQMLQDCYKCTIDMCEGYLRKAFQTNKRGNLENDPKWR